MFSILTPTYNRATTLHRVYQSLLNQTLKSFEWIIIDDGSTDDTENLVNSWMIKSNLFKIKYYKLNQNLGKSNAVNTGLDLCTEKITIIADSDDSFVPNTIAQLQAIWSTVFETMEYKRIAAIWTLVKNENGDLIGDCFPTNFWQVNFENRVLNRKKSISGEKWHSWQTNILKKYKMFDNENSFVSEGATWNRINKDYDFLCINIIHRIYWYSENGLINQKKSRLKVEKNHYYTTYFQLKDLGALNILKFKYYRNVAFDYIKAFYFYRDKNNLLNCFQFIAAVISFCLVLPNKIFFRIANFQH